MLLHLTITTKNTLRKASYQEISPFCAHKQKPLVTELVTYLAVNNFF